MDHHPRVRRRRRRREKCAFLLARAELLRLLGVQQPLLDSWPCFACVNQYLIHPHERLIAPFCARTIFFIQTGPAVDHRRLPSRKQQQQQAAKRRVLVALLAVNKEGNHQQQQHKRMAKREGGAVPLAELMGKVR